MLHLIWCHVILKFADHIHWWHRAWLISRLKWEKVHAWTQLFVLTVWSYTVGWEKFLWNQFVIFLCFSKRYFPTLFTPYLLVNNFASLHWFDSDQLKQNVSNFLKWVTFFSYGMRENCCWKPYTAKLCSKLSMESIWYHVHVHGKWKSKKRFLIWYGRSDS